VSEFVKRRAAEFSITHFCRRNPDRAKSITYARETAKIGRSLFKSSHEVEAMRPFAIYCWLLGAGVLVWRLIQS
jgi:hypothetical protein